MNDILAGELHRYDKRRLPYYYSKEIFRLICRFQELLDFSQLRTNACISYFVQGGDFPLHDAAFPSSATTKEGGYLLSDSINSTALQVECNTGLPASTEEKNGGIWRLRDNCSSKFLVDVLVNNIRAKVIDRNGILNGGSSQGGSLEANELIPKRGNCLLVLCLLCGEVLDPNNLVFQVGRRDNRSDGGLVKERIGNKVHGASSRYEGNAGSVLPNLYNLENLDGSEVGEGGDVGSTARGLIDLVNVDDANVSAEALGKQAGSDIRARARSEATSEKLLVM